MYVFFFLLLLLTTCNRGIYITWLSIDTRNINLVMTISPTAVLFISPVSFLLRKGKKKHRKKGVCVCLWASVGKTAFSSCNVVSLRTHTQNVRVGSTSHCLSHVSSSSSSCFFFLSYFLFSFKHTHTFICLIFDYVFPPFKRRKRDIPSLWFTREFATGSYRWRTRKLFFHIRWNFFLFLKRCCSFFVFYHLAPLKVIRTTTFSKRKKKQFFFYFNGGSQTRQVFFWYKDLTMLFFF